MEKNKSFDAVGMMREIRDEFSEKYLKDPKAEMLDLEKIRRKYKLKSNKKKRAA